MCVKKNIEKSLSNNLEVEPWSLDLEASRKVSEDFI
jgi:hypothetical protein